MRAATAHDYVVIGGGSAGCAVAGRLSEAGADVLLLEAGPRARKLELGIPAAWTKLFRSNVDWNLSTEPQDGLDGRRIYWPRGKTLGGSSAINAMMWVPGPAVDYDRWSALGCSGWSYRELLPYFRRIAVTVSAARDPSPLTLALIEAAVHSGIERTDVFDGEQLEGVGLVPVSQRNGWRSSAADAYVRPARWRRNLTVMTQAHVTRIILDDGRATGVAYLRNGHEERIDARREVILSAGAVGSPQLLLLSGIGPAYELRKLGIDPAVDLPGVGKNLRDHLVAGVLARVTAPISLATAETKANIARYLLRRRGPLTSNLAEAAAFVRTRADLSAPDLELIFAPALYLDEGLTPPVEHGVTIGAVLLRPQSVGELSLGSRDPFAPPSIQPRYLSEARDLEILVEGTRLARRILHAGPFASYRGEEILPGEPMQTDEEIAGVIRQRAHTLYHPVGTCRMGVDELSVVDPALRVHGVEGLRVADASVMPTLISGHTNAAALMIGEKAADLISQGSAL
jgi:choline dehydrogenase-like flavoprotein